jgi:hypothetical protein
MSISVDEWLRELDQHDAPGPLEDGEVPPSFSLVVEAVVGRERLEKMSREELEALRRYLLGEGKPGRRGK